MDFGLRSKQNRGRGHPDGDFGWCDITSMMVKRRGNDCYDFGLTLQGCVVRTPEPTSSNENPRKPSQSLELPVSSRIEIDQDALFKQMSGLRDIFSSVVLPPGLDYVAENIAPLEPDVQDDSPRGNPAPNTNFDLPALGYSETSHEAAGTGQAAAEGDITSLSYDAIAGEYSGNIENDFSAELFGLEIALDNPFPEISFASQDSSPNPSSSTEEEEPVMLGASDPFSAVTDDRRHCRLCNAAFKRPGDVKRHSRVHFPERNFHCRELHCKRNGRHGFYRKDKLRAHQRQVHNM